MERSTLAMDAEARKVAHEQIAHARQTLVSVFRAGRPADAQDLDALETGLVAGAQALAALDEAASHRDPCEFGNLTRRVEDLTAERQAADDRASDLVRQYNLLHEQAEGLTRERDAALRLATELAEDNADRRAKIEHFQGRNECLLRQVEALTHDLDIANANLDHANSLNDTLGERYRATEQRAHRNFIALDAEQRARRQLRDDIAEILMGRWPLDLALHLDDDPPVVSPVVAGMLGVALGELTRRVDAGDLPFARVRGSGALCAYTLGSVMDYLHARHERRQKLLASMVWLGIEDVEPDA